MSTCNHIHLAGALHVYERGGLTRTPGSGTSSVARFGYCEQCDIEVPVDHDELCTYCFNLVSDANNE